ncbi:disease resistance protein TAO1 [Capsella rubella]|nr:disease resistance protein TAO1 [Capsella rubella]
MDSTFFLSILVAAAIAFFIFLRKFRIYQENKDNDVGSSSTSPPSALSSSTSPPTALSYNGTHHVFPSFRGEDVRRNFLSHIQTELRRKAIVPFIDNEIRRGESIGPELIKAIKGAKIAIVLLSRNYASSKWCLDELVEIMKCKKEFGLTVFAIFYEVDPSHVKKLTGEFGSVFKKTCKGRTKEDIWRWRQAFKEVATIAGYDSRNWENESAMIKEIVSEISKRLISYTPSSDFDGFIGMRAHVEKMKQLLCLGSRDERRMVGISGPSGIGKSTIARVLHNQISDGFQLSVFMKFNPSCTRPTCSDDHDVKLQLEQQFLSQLIKQEDIKIYHLGTAQNFVTNKRVLIVLDGVDRLVQLLAMPKAVGLGPGSRIIITTQDQKLLKAFKIKHIYNVDFPLDDEALQIFCMHAFGQDSPDDGFEKLARKVTTIAGNLPLGLRVMGSYFRGMAKEEWKGELPRLRVRLDGEIGSTLKFSYDALNEEDKDLFLHIACFFNDDYIDHTFEDTLRHKFPYLQQGCRVLVQRSLISEEKLIPMHNLLVQLGREIVRNQSISEPGKRQFLVDAREICEVLTDHTGSKSVIGINLNFSSMVDDELILSERAFEEMSNLQFLRLCHKRLYLPEGLNYLSPKLRILHWDYSPMKCFPSKFSPKFLVKIILKYSKLEKLWEGIQPLMNLKVMNLGSSTKLKELPCLSTATNLLEMQLWECSSLIKLPNSIGNATNIQTLNLRDCSSLVELPSSIGNAINLQTLQLTACSSLVKLPLSVGNFINLKYLYLNACSSLVELPSSIGNVINLQTLVLTGCSSLVKLHSSIGNLINLLELDLRRCSSLVELPSSIGSVINLKKLELSGCLSLVKLPSSIGNVINLHDLYLNECSSLVELPSSIGNVISLSTLNLDGCSSLVDLPSSIGDITSLKVLHLNRCSSLAELPSSIGNIINLKQLDLRECSNLVKLPSSIGNLINLSTLNLDGCSSLVDLPSSIGNLIDLWILDLHKCSSLVELPSSIGDIISLKKLNLSGCLSLVKLPSSIGNLINLQKLNLRECSSLVELPSSIGDIINLEKLDFRGCSSLVELPSSIRNLCMLVTLRLQGCSKIEALPDNNVTWDSLEKLDVTGCSQLISFPVVSKNIRQLMLCGTLIKEVPLLIKSWSRLHDLRLTYWKDLEEFPHVLDIITELKLDDSEIEQVPTWVNGISQLRRLVLSRCSKLVSLPQLPGTLSNLDAVNCESLERLGCSFSNPEICLKFIECWKLNEKGRDIIIQTSTSEYAVLPGREVPAFFSYRSTTGGSVVVKLNKRCLSTSLRFKACILLVRKGNKADYEECESVNLNIVTKQSGGDGYISRFLSLRPVLTNHLYTFEGEVNDVESIELFFKFEVDNDRWKIGECGIRPLLEEDTHYVEVSI